jgi:phage terminase large subunit
MKSLAGATHVLIEEANELSEDDFDQMKLSLRTVKGQEIRVIRVFNPPSKNHWLWRDYTLYPIDDNYFRAEVKEGAHIESIFSTFSDNKKNLDDSFLRFVRRYQNSTIQRDIEYYHTEILGLISSGAKGRIYKGWQQCSVADFELIDRRSMYVMDFGYSEDPTVIMQMKFEGECVYCRELMYMSGCDNVELMRRMLDMGLTDKDIIIADPGSGGDVRIAELRRGFFISSHPAAEKGMMIYGAHKGAGSVIAGIGAVQGRKIIVTDDSRNTWNEYLGYVWALDKEKNPIDRPIEKNDHAMDCIRMGVLNKEKFI